MKKNISKKLAVSMAAGMGAVSMIGNVAPVFAMQDVGTNHIEGVQGEQSDVAGLTAKITAKNINEADVTVTAYQLVDGYYDNNNLIKYVLTDPVNGAIADIENPTAEEITAIANAIGAGTFLGEAHDMTAGSEYGEYEATVEPGLYLILVGGGSRLVYNPAIVAVNVADANDPVRITAGEVDLDDAFSVKGTAAYIKSSGTHIYKSIVDSSEGIDRGDTVAVGDKISFKLDNMTIPSFSGDYEAPVYKIADTLEAGKFEAIENLVVKVNGEVVAPDAGVYDLTLNANDFVISFTEDYLRSVAANATRPTVEVTYDSALTADAGMNYAENHNKATVEYSCDPTDPTNTNTITNNATYHYTFAIDGLLDGEAGDVIPDIINKIKYDKDAEGNNVRVLLEGAEFTLYSDAELTDVLQVSETDENGRFLFDGLDEGVYYIKETQAPAGYSLNDNVYRVTISATLDAEFGVMTEYSMITEVKTVTDTDFVAAGSAVFTNMMMVPNDLDGQAQFSVNTDGSVTNNIQANVQTVDIVNTRLQNLPSTGGTGTAVAFAVSAGLAATTGGIVVTAKKKENK